MNKDQRKYLTDWVSKGFEKEKEEIKSRRFERPNLNNYLVAEAMQGTLKVKPSKNIAEYVKNILIRSGKNDVLVTHKEDRYYGDNSVVRTGKHKVTLEAEQVFEIPKEYTQKLKEWEENERSIQEDLDRLQGIKDTVLLKVNIGSDKALEAIIAQADSLASLDLVNKQLTTAAGNKLLTD